QNNNNSNSELEDDDLMKFTYEIIDAKTNKSQGTVYYYDGNKIVALSDKDQLKIIREIYKDTTGKSMKNYKWRTDTPWYVRFMQAINQKAVEVAWK
ncbi:lysozyme, partial [Lactococcus lactis]|nr:lysozyme [Lactococcus lactis]